MEFRNILRPVVLSLILALPALPVQAAEIYYTDQGHTEIRLSWSHAGVSMQSAEFTKANGKLSLDPGKVESSSINVTIDAASI